MLLLYLQLVQMIFQVLVLYFERSNDNGFVFFTNYKSHKGQEIEVNPKVALNFFLAFFRKASAHTRFGEKVSDEESDAYFRRPYKPIRRLGV